MEKKKYLSTVKRYIETELNPSENFYDPKRSDFQEVNTIEELLNSLQLSQTVHYLYQMTLISRYI